MALLCFCCCLTENSWRLSQDLVVLLQLFFGLTHFHPGVDLGHARRDCRLENLLLSGDDGRNNSRLLFFWRCAGFGLLVLFCLLFECCPNEGNNCKNEDC